MWASRITVGILLIAFLVVTAYFLWLNWAMIVALIGGLIIMTAVQYAAEGTVWVLVGFFLIVISHLVG